MLAPLEARPCVGEAFRAERLPEARPVWSSSWRLIPDKGDRVEVLSRGEGVAAVRVVEAEQGVVLEADLGGLSRKDETAARLIRRTSRYAVYSEADGAATKRFDCTRHLLAYRELAFLTLLRHEHVVTLEAVNLAVPTRPALSLAERWTGLTLEEKPRFRYAIEAARALSFLHEHAIIHRDVRPCSFWIVADACKLADLSKARLFPGDHADDRRAMTQSPTTLRYMSPECVRGEPYSLKADVFSWALLAYYALYRRAPYGHDLSAHRRCHFRTHKRPLLTFETPHAILAAPVLRQAWAEDPAQRPSFHDILALLASRYGRPARLLRTARALLPLRRRLLGAGP
mmetsp:Transcript_2762/g.8706  ORF Transcript_2762/g.8706 Transcript_2762/m.8706 type:complete len:343 (-) Transcript_2762:189-1217(-)